MDIDAIVADRTLDALSRRLARNRGVVHAAGLWGSSAPMLVARVNVAAAAPWLYITSHLQDAEHTLDDLELFGDRRYALFPPWESLLGQDDGGGGEVEAERARILRQLAGRLDGRRGAGAGGDGRARAGVEEPPPAVIVAPIHALMQLVPTPAALAERTLQLAPRSTLDPQALLRWAVRHGYERLELVESPGDVAQRGDIVDFFPPGEPTPIRVTFDGDEVESIRRFDVGTQRSCADLPAIDLPAAGPMAGRIGKESRDRLTDLLDYLPPDALIVVDDPAAVAEMAATYQRRAGGAWSVHPADVTLQRIAPFPQLHLSHLGSAPASTEDVFTFDIKSLTRFEGDTALTELREAAAGHDVHVFCDNAGERDRLREMLLELGGALPARLNLHVGVVHRGFEWTSAETIVVGHHEIFHRTRQRRRVRRDIAARPIDTWTDLKPGDFVVHAVHGIALFRGLRTMRKGDSAKQGEFLVLEFAETANLYVPTTQIDLVQKYIGSGGGKPRLSRLGGRRWARTKDRVADSVADLAESLLRTQAAREAAVGTAYPPDTEWQREFEASFLFEETEDQLVVAGEIKTDLRKPRPMDRLLCGDVGYGKTELAMRAAFKVVEYGRQVALLVPTTVLAEQHYETFRERMAEYPFIVGCLSRFRTVGEQRKLVAAARKGQVDIVIGTHRLLSKDIGFANLGLVIIDEEQRFGVEHKERLKQLRATVDVLTLTATPIPRTLHMAMMGLRDISALQTPPIDRRAIVTRVSPYNAALIRDAILREMTRDGQVFFINNFVHNIESVADDVRKIVPDARVLVGHGQMKDGQLEKVMHAFVRHEADVLVATTIVESGIDIPKANTILINRAERFGLADLHQLRGRVGRSNHRAYCYLLVPPDRPLIPKALRRLKAIEEFSELGAGFRIAMRDLEIRGAGNILGAEQSGHIGAVGYDMYCRLLERSVRQKKKRGQDELPQSGPEGALGTIHPDPLPADVHVEIDVQAQIPRDYVAAERSRIEIYRRLASCTTVEDVSQLEKDLIDAFGPLPKQIETLMQLAEVRVRARRFGVQSIILQVPDVIFRIETVARAEPLFTDAPGTVRWPDPQTIHLRPPPRYLEPGTLLPVLRRMLAKACERDAVVAGAGT
ncbi:MAG: transcription-repair coupling factor [Phycisphaerales bacterium]|nr:MAG: transcription-repair coupling factor [Phycisphaerales bacterium]